MKQLKISLNLLVLCSLVFSVNAKSADVISSQQPASSVSVTKKILPYPMQMKADDPYARALVKWQKKQLKNSKVREAKARKKRGLNNTVFKLPLILNDKSVSKHIIDLEVTDDKEKTVNKTKSFVFNDETKRVGLNAIDIQNQEKRYRQIETLRHLITK